MTKSIFKFVIAILLLTNGALLNAQVTIGGNTAPKSGALLDLNSTTKGGLLLPNVEITDLGKIPATFTDVSVQNAEIAPELAGLVVFNTTSVAAANIHRGIYAWDGENWRLLAIDGGNMSIPATTRGYDPNNPIGAEDNLGTGDIPISNPGLDIVGQYSFAVIAGSEYATVDAIDVAQSIFSVQFQPNPTAYARKCVVLVTDPAGRTGTFIFTQEGSACLAEVAVTVGTYGIAALCQNGSVHAYVSAVSTGSVDDYDYYWVRNGVEVAQGTGVELKQIGTYMVFADKIGCGTAGTINVTASSNTASIVPHIIVDNNGILCGTSGVTLSAINAPSASGLIWVKDGLKQAENTTSYYVSAIEANQGIWYLVYSDGGCSSVSSNKINIVYTTSGATLPTPVALINNLPISSGSLTICAGGTLELTIDNASAYSTYSNVAYEWFGNGQSLGKTTSSTMYVVPPTIENLVITLTVTASDQCPKSVTTGEFSVLTGSTPPPTSINTGDERAYICASHPAVLTAGATGSAYQWFRSGQEISETTNPISVTQTGVYTVRYANATGCWSTISTPIEVIQSAPVSLYWAAAPAAEEIFESSKTYSVITAPNADVIEWEIVNPAYTTDISITKLGNGNAATITYGNTEITDFQIKVTATNSCGTAELISDNIHVKAGCVPTGSVVVTPSSAHTIEEGQNITFTASANTGSNHNLVYKWYVDNVEQATTGTTFNFTTPSPFPSKPAAYQIVARAFNDCNATLGASSAPVSVVVTINPKTLPKVPNPDVIQPHFLGGKTCLDVHVTNGNATDNPWNDGGRLPLALRPNDFNNGNKTVFTYTFSTVGGSNIRFILDDPQNITQSVSGDANASSALATVTFRPNIVTAATGTTKNTALSVTLYAVYAIGGNDYQESITIKIQDQCCGCPAKVTANTWQMFQCHNPGADTSIDPLNTSNSASALRGAYYAWGRKLPVRDRNFAVATPQPTTTRPATWTSWENPCEPGWKVAPQSTWRNVSSNNTISRRSTYLIFGNYLVLPSQGYRTGTTSFATGTSITDEPGYHYWTESSNSATNGDNFYRGGGTSTAAPVFSNFSKNYLESVRCIQEGSAYSEND